MKPVNDVLEVRRVSELILRNTDREYAPYAKTMATVSVSDDFVHYVSAMADKWPDDTEHLGWPPEDELRWPFHNQAVCFVWEQPMVMPFLIVSRDTPAGHEEVTPHVEPTETISMLVLPPGVKPVRVVGDWDHKDLENRMAVYPVLFMHPNLTSTTSTFPFGVTVRRRRDMEVMGKVARWERAFAEAVGHRLARLDEPEGLPKPERRRLQRMNVPYRLLQLRTPERPTADSDGHRHVEWSKRWTVRGHWRNQAYGPGMTLHRNRWIDPYIKGPDDKPMDNRDPVFRVDEDPEDDQ